MALNDFYAVPPGALFGTTEIATMDVNDYLPGSGTITPCEFEFQSFTAANAGMGMGMGMVPPRPWEAGYMTMNDDPATWTSPYFYNDMYSC